MADHRIYRVFADYATQSEAELFHSTDKKEAIAWAEEYVADGRADWCSTIEVAYFAPDDEFMSVYRHDNADFEDSVNIVDEW